MKKLIMFFILGFALNNNLFAQIEISFSLVPLRWYNSTTPLETYRLAYSQNYPYQIDEKTIKNANVYEITNVLINKRGYSKPVPLDTNKIFIPDYYSPKKIFYYDTLGRLIKSQYYYINDDMIFKIADEYFYQSDSSAKVISYSYAWALDGINAFSTSYETDTFYYKINSSKKIIESLEAEKGSICLGNFLQIDTLYYTGKKTIEYLPGEFLHFKSLPWTTPEGRIKFDGADIYIFFNKDGLPSEYRIRYMKYEEKDIEYKDEKYTETRVEYYPENFVKRVVEDTYVINSKGDTVFVRSDTLVCSDNFLTSKDYSLFLNGELIFRRKITKYSLLEQNFGNKDYRFIKFDTVTHLPVYQIRLKKINRYYYLYRENVINYVKYGDKVIW